MAEFQEKANAGSARRLASSSSENAKASIRLAQSDIQYVRSGGATHTWSDEEKAAFSMHINNCLGSDPIASRHLPLNEESMDLFERTSDGLLLCRLIHLANPDTIDERALNVRENLNVYQKTENINLALNAAKSIGCQVINIGAADIMEGRPILILGIVWQIIKIQLLSMISLANFPELVLLLEGDEDLAAFMKLHPEQILLRWVNYHLNRANFPRRIANFGNDVKDSEVYSTLMHAIKPSVCPLITATEPMQRAAQAIANAQAYGAEVFIHAKDIVDGNKKLNMSFVAQLFNTCHGLNLTEEARAAFDFSSLDLDDEGDNREERVLRMWINSLNMEDVYVNNLFHDLEDGQVLLKLAESSQPGAVDFRRVNKNPVSRFKKVENCNYAVTVCQALKLSVVNVGGLDIADRNKKLILSLISQLMRKYTLKVLAELAQSTSSAQREVSEMQIIAWANQRVENAGRASRMRNFKDKNLATGLFFLDLCAAIEPSSIDWSVVTRGTTSEDKTLNAKYAISTARKLGAAVFLTHEDISEVKQKTLLTFTASIWTADINRTH